MSLKAYKEAANLFYGLGTGDLIYDFAQNMCREAFDGAISPEVRIILTTAQSAYNQSYGWCWPKGNTIELVRQHCKSTSEGVVPRDKRSLLLALAHEFCHLYQYQVLGGKIGSRGPHRCRSWYDAITKASPYICGVDVQGICKPFTSKRESGRVIKFNNPASLTEVELTHWPDSIYELIENKDSRLKGRIVDEAPVLAKINFS